jgi:hypothetical protein
MYFSQSVPFRPVGDRQTVQAMQFIRALRHELHEMTTKLVQVERQEVTTRNGRACAMRDERRELNRINA